MLWVLDIKLQSKENAITITTFYYRHGLALNLFLEENLKVKYNVKEYTIAATQVFYIHL